MELLSAPTFISSAQPKTESELTITKVSAAALSSAKLN